MTETTVLDVLQTAHTILSNPSHWTQETFARDADGCAVFALSPAAVAWCALGALEKAAAGNGFLYGYAVNALETACMKRYGSYDVAVKNDRHDHAAVMELFALAVKLREELDAQA